MKAIVLSVAISAAALVSSACDAPGTPDPAPIDDKSCTLDVDCDADAVCRANLCVQDLGGGGNPGAGEGEGGGANGAPSSWYKISATPRSCSRAHPSLTLLPAASMTRCFLWAWVSVKRRHSPYASALQPPAPVPTPSWSPATPKTWRCRWLPAPNSKATSQRPPTSTSAPSTQAPSANWPWSFTTRDQAPSPCKALRSQEPRPQASPCQ